MCFLCHVTLHQGNWRLVRNTAVKLNAVAFTVAFKRVCESFKNFCSNTPQEAIVYFIGEEMMCLYIYGLEQSKKNFYRYFRNDMQQSASSIAPKERVEFVIGLLLLALRCFPRDLQLIFTNKGLGMYRLFQQCSFGRSSSVP